MGNGIEPEAAGIRHLSSVPERPGTELGPLWYYTGSGIGIFVVMFLPVPE
jgi:hypothetical protein